MRQREWGRWMGFTGARQAEADLHSTGKDTETTTQTLLAEVDWK